MTDVILFHHVHGLTDGVREFVGELWNRGQPPGPDEERELMAHFGMEPA